MAAKQKWLTLLLLLVSSALAAAKGSPVKFLPGFDGPLPFELETGYIGVGVAEEVQLFYYFVKSGTDPQVDPLLLWITGGPGCSSFTALAYEFGPIMFEPVEEAMSPPRLVLNPNSWTDAASIIFLDSPVGTGFSYATKPEARNSNTLMACNEVDEFLRKFLVDHPEFISNPFYVGGDSFSGLLVPVITQLISQGNERGFKPPIDLKGYILGNPVTNIPNDYNYQVPFSYGMGLLSNELYESLETNCKGKYMGVDPTNLPCLDDLKAFNQLLRNIAIVNILEPTCFSSSSNAESLISHELIGRKWCRDDGYIVSASWANDKAVWGALQIQNGSIEQWQRCNYMVRFETTVLNCVPYHANLSSKGRYRSLIYSGDRDFVIPYLATEAWIKSLNYSITDDWRKWLVESQVAGYTRTFANKMTFATVKGGGHTAPEYKPSECKALFERWISHKPI